MRLKELVDASNGYLKRDYSAEKIGGTKGRPYKPVRIPKKRITTKANTQASDKETNTETPKYKVLCNIDSSKYKAPEGSSPKVILMDERKKHIKESHPEAVDAIVKNLPSILTDPDAVYIENGKENTRWVVKKLDDHNAKITLKLSTGDSGKFHSIITGQFMRPKQIEKAENKGRITKIYFKGDQEYTVSEEKPKVEE